MRFTANTFLISIFVSFFSISIFTGLVHFKLLDDEFWKTSFAKHNLYSSLSDNLKRSAEESVVNEGGKRSDAQVLTNLITPENVQDVVDKNLTNLFSYATGGGSELYVYVPVNKIPKGLIPIELTGISEQMPISQLFTKFNVQGINLEQIKYISLVGKSVLYTFILSTILLLISFVLLVALVKNGGRMISPGIALILSGLSTLAVYLVVVSSPTKTELGIAALEITKEVFTIPIYVSIAAIVIGIIMFFIRRPGEVVKIPLNVNR